MAELREAVKDALAAEILRWGIKPEKLPAGEKHLAGLVVDAFLDALEAHWETLVAVQRKGRSSKRRVADIYVVELPAVLREGDE